VGNAEDQNASFITNSDSFSDTLKQDQTGKLGISRQAAHNGLW
jgi:hypothetical protein